MAKALNPRLFCLHLTPLNALRLSSFTLFQDWRRPDERRLKQKPPPHRLEKARKRGHPAFRERLSPLILLVGVSVICLAVCRWPVDCRACSPAGLHFDHSIPTNLIPGDYSLIREAALALLPLIRRGAAAIISRLCWGGWYFGKSLAEVFKLNPLPGIKRIFSVTDWREFRQFENHPVGSVTGFFLWHHWPQMMRLMASLRLPPGNAMDL